MRSFQTKSVAPAAKTITRRRGGKLARYLAATALVGAAASWAPKIAHLGLSWGEVGHSVCETPLLPHTWVFALIAAAAVCEIGDVVQACLDKAQERPRARDHFMLAVWIFLLLVSVACKSAHLLASWAIAMGVPCLAQDPLLTLFFAPPVQLSILALASAWSVKELVEDVHDWARRIRLSLRRSARLAAAPA